MFTVPRPPGNATPRSGWHSLSISAFLIGPAARPPGRPLPSPPGKLRQAPASAQRPAPLTSNAERSLTQRTPRDARLPAAGLQFIGDAMDEQPECTDTTWTVCRMDETGNTDSG